MDAIEIRTQVLCENRNCRALGVAKFHGSLHKRQPSGTRNSARKTLNPDAERKVEGRKMKWATKLTRCHVNRLIVKLLVFGTRFFPLSVFVTQKKPLKPRCQKEFEGRKQMGQKTGVSSHRLIECSLNFWFLTPQLFPFGMTLSSPPPSPKTLNPDAKRN